MSIVLLVDDEVVAIRALERRVSWEKYGITKVYMANSMQQAIAVFEQHEIDLMLCDIEMPQGTGLELFEWVKCHDAFVECVYVTCHPEFEYVKKAMKLGSMDYILKPIDYQELDEILQRAVKRILKNEEKKKAERNLKSAIERLSGSDEASSTDTVRIIKSYIQEHITEDLSIDIIARNVHLNGQYMMRLFRKKEDMSILEYITGERIALAKGLLLETDKNVQQIADSVGYGNYSYFNRIFKRYTQMTPLDYRKEMQRASR